MITGTATLSAFSSYLSNVSFPPELDIEFKSFYSPIFKYYPYETFVLRNIGYDSEVPIIFPFMQFRIHEVQLPNPGDIKGVRLLGVYANGELLSVNSYVHCSAFFRDISYDG